MNTREKILSALEARERLSFATPAPELVIGYFDPLLADAIPPDCAPLWVAVDDPAEPLYSIDSRLKLVAALRQVTHVFPYESGLENWPFSSVTDLRSAHLAMREKFIRQVHARHRQ